MVFAVWQIRQYRQQRRDAAAIELVRTLQSREFVEAFRLLSRVPDGISLEALRAKGSEYEDTAITLGAMGETIGLMVYRSIAPYELVREQVGGLLLTMWQKLRVWAEQVRGRPGVRALGGMVPVARRPAGRVRAELRDYRAGVPETSRVEAASLTGCRYSSLAPFASLAKRNPQRNLPTS